MAHWEEQEQSQPNRAAQNCQIFALIWIICVKLCFQLLPWWMHRPALGRFDRSAELRLHSPEDSKALPPCSVFLWAAWLLLGMFFELVLAQWIFILAFPFQFLVFGLQGISLKATFAKQDLSVLTQRGSNVITAARGSSLNSFYFSAHHQ